MSHAVMPKTGTEPSPNESLNDAENAVAGAKDTTVIAAFVPPVALAASRAGTWMGAPHGALTADALGVALPHDKQRSVIALIRCVLSEATLSLLSG